MTDDEKSPDTFVEDAAYETVTAAIKTSEWEITKIFDLPNTPLTFQEAIRMGEGGKGQMVIGPNDFDRKPEHFLEPMQCMLHLNEIIKFALQDWFARMCDPDGVKISASELWGESDQQEQDKPC